MRIAYFLGAAARAVNAWFIDPAPAATDAIAMKELGDAKGWSPIPTTAPVHRDLLRRQAATQILGYLAPDNTCGYVSGRIGGVKTCATDANCAAVIGTDSFYTMGCCNAGMCTMQGACYDYASMADCDHACQQDVNILKCSKTGYPYCYPYSVPGMNMGFYSCDSVTTSVFQDFETTYLGETAHQWIALRSSDFDSLLSSSTSTTNHVTGGQTITPASTGSITASVKSATTTPTALVSTRRRHTPIGAVVGGVVGGLVVLALTVGAVVFILMKQRMNKNKQAAATAADVVPPANPPMTQYTPPQPPTGGAPSTGYFAPVAAGGKLDTSAPKYDNQGIGGPQVTEYPATTPVSPAPAYSSPVLPSQNPPPEVDPRLSYAPPPPQGYSEAPANYALPPAGPTFSYAAPQQQGYSEAPANYVPPPQQQQTHYPPPSSATASAPQGIAAPAELGNNYAVPNQYQGRPVYEAA